MNKRWLRIEIMVSVILAVSIVGLVKGDDKTTVAEFDKAYSSWRKYVLEGPRSDLTSNPYYRAMVQLGPSAVPLLMEKIQVDPPAKTLISTVQRLTKKRFTQEEMEGIKSSADRVTLWVEWWKATSEQTPQDFGKLYEEWQVLKIKGEKNEADVKYQRIKDLGIVALPYMISKVQNGDADLISMISELTDGAVQRMASPSECVDWWNKNKKQWVLLPKVDFNEEK